MLRSLLLLVLCGCASSISRTVHPPEKPLTISAVVVVPVRLTGTENAGWRQFELGQRQVQTLLDQHGDRLAIFGPGQVQISRWDEPGWLGNSAVPVLTREAQPVDETLVLKSMAEQRVAQSNQEREDSSGQRKGGLASQETTWVLTTELVHPSSRQVLVELTGTVIIDPFADPKAEDEFDPAAPVTHLLERMAKDAVAIAAPWFKAREHVKQSWRARLSPAVTAAQRDASGAQKDALQAEVWMQARARYLNPDIDDATAARLARTPAALEVVEVEGLLEGELVLSIDGAPPLPEVLARKRLSGRATARVGKAGVERDVVIR